MSARADRHQGITAARGREVHQSGIQPGRIASISVQIIEKQPNGPNGHVWLVVLLKRVFHDAGQEIGQSTPFLLCTRFQLLKHLFRQRNAGSSRALFSHLELNYWSACRIASGDCLCNRPEILTVASKGHTILLSTPNQSVPAQCTPSSSSLCGLNGYGMTKCNCLTSSAECPRNPLAEKPKPINTGPLKEIPPLIQRRLLESICRRSLTFCT